MNWKKARNQSIKRAFHWGGFFLLLLVSACKDEETSAKPQNPAEPFFYRAADLSSLPEVQEAGLIFFNQDSIEGDFLDILESKGLNTVRLRLWVNPENQHCSLAQVDSFANVLRNRGLKIWLCLHLSDTWADPGHQEIPAAWNTLSLTELSDTLYQYVYRVSKLIKPDIIQIGNEINPGFLLPLGSRNNAFEDYKTLLKRGVEASRAAYPSAQIMIHYTGIEEAQSFYTEIADLDFDLIGVSYYPLWHGKSLLALRNRLSSLAIHFNQDIIVAETSYPFTLEWNDWTHNTVGLEEQLVPGYSASPAGQKAFLMEVRRIVEENEKGVGFAYWGGERVAWKGPQGVNASSSENQALFNFNLVGLPVLDVFEP